MFHSSNPDGSFQLPRRPVKHIVNRLRILGADAQLFVEGITPELTQAALDAKNGFVEGVREGATILIGWGQGAAQSVRTEMDALKTPAHELLNSAMTTVRDLSGRTLESLVKRKR